MPSDRWLLGGASVCSFLSLVFVIIINAAGTSMRPSTSLDRHNSPVLGEFYILQDVAIYDPFSYSENSTPSWFHRFYLNGACSTPNICRKDNCSHDAYPRPADVQPEVAAAFWTICHYKAPGHAIDIHAILEVMDRHLYGHDGVFPHASEAYSYLAPGNWSFPVTNPYLPHYLVPTTVPFLLYLLGATASFCVLAAFVGHFIWKMKAKRLAQIPILSRWTAILALAMMSFALLAYSVAIGLLNSDLNKIINYLSHAKTNVADLVSAGPAFLAMGWCAVTSQLFAVMMIYRPCRRCWRYRKNPNIQTRSVGEEQRLENLNYERGVSVDGEAMTGQDWEQTSEGTAPPPYEAVRSEGTH